MTDPRKKHFFQGQVFGDWTVIERAPNSKCNKAMWKCRCVCGKEKTIYQTHLICGKSKTCTTKGTHGIGTKTPGHSSYSSMISRCYLPTHEAYHRYGGRGIQVCGKWLKGFVSFYEDMGPRPDGMTLERIDCNGNYEPSNCRWATHREQQNNTCTNRFLIRDGEKVTIANVARKSGIKYATLYSRLKRTGEI
jgi:hypothetical protein